MKQLWIEQYRPTKVEDYVFADEHKRQQVESWIKDGIIPHLLLCGSPGTGKTTLAKLLLHELDVADYDIMYANGSKEARKIEWLDKLIGFCQTMPYGAFKIVLIDEADYMNPSSVQPALRNLMEDYSQTVRFILTCNYPNKILPAIHSRCQKYEISKTDKTEFTARAATVLLTEGIEFGMDVLDSYVDATYPDLRSCLKLLQANSITGKLTKPTDDDTGTSDWKFASVDLIKAGRLKEARTLICSQATMEDMDSMFRWMYDNLDLWSDTEEGQDQAILVIKKGLVSHGMVTDTEINLSATLVELAQIGK
jgi:DNA polymerase III delta prime subunit